MLLLHKSLIYLPGSKICYSNNHRGILFKESNRNRKIWFSRDCDDSRLEKIKTNRKYQKNVIPENRQWFVEARNRYMHKVSLSKLSQNVFHVQSCWKKNRNYVESIFLIFPWVYFQIFLFHLFIPFHTLCPKSNSKSIRSKNYSKGWFLKTVYLDRITAIVFKNCVPQLLLILIRLLQISHNNGMFPNGWKTVGIIERACTQNGRRAFGESIRDGEELIYIITRLATPLWQTRSYNNLQRFCDMNCWVCLLADVYSSPTQYIALQTSYEQSLINLLCYITYGVLTYILQP